MPGYESAESQPPICDDTSDSLVDIPAAVGSQHPSADGDFGSSSSMFAPGPRMTQEETDSGSNGHDHCEAAEDANAESLQADGDRGDDRRDRDTSLLPSETGHTPEVRGSSIQSECKRDQADNEEQEDE